MDTEVWLGLLAGGFALFLIFLILVIAEIANALKGIAREMEQDRLERRSLRRAAEGQMAVSAYGFSYPMRWPGNGEVAMVPRDDKDRFGIEEEART